MSKVRVVVVDDSRTVRERLCEVLASHPEFEVVGQGADGRRAIELCEQLRPDVMTMDMVLPVLSGLAATEYIMAHVPTPILIVSASFNRGDLFKTYDALAAGAVDVLEKPRGDETDESWERTFLSTLRLVARIKVITHLRGRHGAQRSPRATPQPEGPPEVRPRVSALALGASTGGPGALVEVLRAVPTSLGLPIFVVLHLGEAFGRAFVDWLGEQTGHRTVQAAQGALVSSLRGTVVVAPPSAHLTVCDGRVRLTSDPPRHSCRPSVDVLFESLAASDGASVAAALLTGMGRDGAAGLLALRNAGAFTVAQDEATSVVYGMPREAKLLGAAERVLPLEAIGRALAARAEERS